MTPRNLKFASFAAALAAALALAGCLSDSPDDGSSSGGSDGGFSFEVVTDILGITEPTASVAGTFETRDIEYYCEGSDVVSDTLFDESRYAISGGNLYVWEDGECAAMKMSGSSSTLIGKWTASSLVVPDTIPAAYRGSCFATGGDEEDEIDTAFFKGYKATYEFSETKVKVSASGKICMGALFAAALAGSEDEEAALFQVTASDCGTATVKNTINNQSLKVTTSFANERVSISFASGGKKCTLSQSMDLSNKAPTCPEPDDEAAEEAFDACTETLPFFTEGMDEMAKRSAASLDNDVLKTVKRSLRGR